MNHTDEIEKLTQLNTWTNPVETSLSGGYPINAQVSMISNVTLTTLINPSISFQCQGAVSPTTYGAIEQNVIGYLWRSFFDTIPLMDLEKNLKEYEQKYQLLSQEFYKKWQRGEFEDTRETNQWASLFLQLR